MKIRQWLNKHQKTFKQIELTLITTLIVNGICGYTLYSIGWIGPKPEQETYTEETGSGLFDDAFSAIDDGLAIANGEEVEGYDEEKKAPTVSGNNSDGLTASEITVRVEDKDQELVMLSTESGENVTLKCPANWHYKTNSYIDVMKQTMNNENIEAPNLICFCNSTNFLRATQYIVASPISQTDAITKIVSGEDANLEESRSYAYRKFAYGTDPDDTNHTVTELGTITSKTGDVYKVYQQSYNEDPTVEEARSYVISAFGPQEDPVEIIVYYDNSSDVESYLSILRETLEATDG